MKRSGLKRGALIVFEGCDKAGKTTQCRKLVEALKESGISAQFMQFPDRSTSIGKIINNYLVKKEDLSDKAVHLLFSANRWEYHSKMSQLLRNGVTLVVDRYSYSGIAYSAAKPGMNFKWCYQPEIGLLKPDLVFLLHVPAELSMNRKEFGLERYEDNDFQQAVFNNYLKLKDDTWKMIDASKSIEEVQEELLKHSQELIRNIEANDIKEIT